MVRRIKVSFSCTKEELQAARRAADEDTAAVIFFLIGAERENLMLQGHTAKATLAAACRLLRISDEQLAKLSEAAL